MRNTKSLYTQIEEQKETIKNSMAQGIKIALKNKDFAKSHKAELKKIEALNQLDSDIKKLNQCLFVVGNEADRNVLKIHTGISRARINKAVEHLLSTNEIHQFKVGNSTYISRH